MILFFKEAQYSYESLNLHLVKLVLKMKEKMWSIVSVPSADISVRCMRQM